MGVVSNGSFISSYYGDQIDALLAAMAQANPMPSGTDWVAFIDDCRAAQSAAEAAQTAAETAETNASGSASTAATKANESALSATASGDSANTAAQKATAAANSATSAANSAATAQSAASTAATQTAAAIRSECEGYVTSSKSWAVGGTNTRAGEDTNNAKYWAEQASHAAGGGVYSFNNRAGYVLPQSGDYTVDMIEGALPIYGKGRNLLDNWYFGDASAIIDQRGGYVLIANATYYTDTALTQNPVTVSAYTTVYYPDVHSAYIGFYLTDDPTGTEYYASKTDCVRGYTGSGYGIDRWSGNSSSTVLIKSDCIKINVPSGLNMMFRQNLDPQLYAFLVGKKVTGAVLFSDGTLMSGTVTFPPTTEYNWVTICSGSSLIYQIVPSARRIQIYDGAAGESKGIAALSLELGDALTCFTNLGTEQSPNWVPSSIPDYGEELAKCQRYLLKCGSPNELFVQSSYISASQISFSISVPVSMRAIPTIISGAPRGVYSNGWVTDFTWSVRNANNAIILVATKASHGLTSALTALNNMLLSAEL